jgi:hypothetical protein
VNPEDRGASFCDRSPALISAAETHRAAGVRWHGRHCRTPLTRSVNMTPSPWLNEQGPDSTLSGFARTTSSVLHPSSPRPQEPRRTQFRGIPLETSQTALTGSWHH